MFPRTLITGIALVGILTLSACTDITGPTTSNTSTDKQELIPPAEGGGGSHSFRGANFNMPREPLTCGACVHMNWTPVESVGDIRVYAWAVLYGGETYNVLPEREIHKEVLAQNAINLYSISWEVPNISADTVMFVVKIYDDLGLLDKVAYDAGPVTASDRGPAPGHEWTAD